MTKQKQEATQSSSCMHVETHMGFDELLSDTEEACIAIFCDN
jgi:hypothetical protein